MLLILCLVLVFDEIEVVMRFMMNFYLYFRVNGGEMCCIIWILVNFGDVEFVV